jgi:hypothetical protein
MVFSWRLPEKFVILLDLEGIDLENLDHRLLLK